jgi:nicotinamidase/pyrazinamidase
MMKYENSALILVDIQVDFCKGGALEVKEGDAVIPIANKLMPLFETVVATQDWHPANHESFAANHLWRKPGQVIQLHGLEQVLWVIHCVQGSFGAEFAPGLELSGVHKIVQKGMNPQVDSYSGFYDNGRRFQTEMAEYLRSKNIKKVYVMGLATDYCVKFTALDALSEGFETYLIVDGSRGVNLQPDDVSNSIEQMQKAGIQLIQSTDLG